MHEKSSAKLGEVKGHRGGNGRRGSEVRCERGAPLTGAARMYSPPAQSDGSALENNSWLYLVRSWGESGV